MSLAFHIENFGCRAARADGEAVAERLRASGHCEGQPALADVVVVNTCSVTAEADREARAYIRRTNRLNPGARIVVTGCYAQRAPEELASLPAVAAVVGNSHKALVPEVVEAVADAKRTSGKLDLHTFCNQGTTLVGPQTPQNQRGLRPLPPHQPHKGHSPPASRAQVEGAEQQVFNETSQGFVDLRAVLQGAATHAAPIFADDRFAHSFLEDAQVVPGAQTRPNLKIQEGCGNRCTFCVIPQTRGGSRSLPEEKVLAQVRGFIEADGRELVLSGINLGRWGHDLSDGPRKHSLAGLVRRIFAETELARLRLSSIEPMDWNSDLIGLMREFGGTRLARHAHLPLQSGSDAVLRRMHRRYRPWHYTEKVHALREAAGPDLTVGADVMVGFPGETDAEFNETVQLIRQLPFGYLHLFPFSPRPGTRGWELHKQTPVPAAVVEERLAQLRRLAFEKSLAHRSSFVGWQVECITLHTAEPAARQGRSAALTENFLPIEIKEAGLAANQAMVALVTDVTSDGRMLAVRHK